ncbi:hypothetical protein PVAP13_5KG364807 [Panicum virgatum]|uniref:Uncharacterized protein n=1 Tax=Panicum virgatum TaxID=38727 RepID=A0A8T0SJM2_PANVG|nr:hypothetical protein PVAP13_5KG364807 [Panicum virgatum]
MGARRRRPLSLPTPPHSPPPRAAALGTIPLPNRPVTSPLPRASCPSIVCRLPQKRRLRGPSSKPPRPRPPPPSLLDRDPLRHLVIPFHASPSLKLRAIHPAPVWRRPCRQRPYPRRRWLDPLRRLPMLWSALTPCRSSPARFHCTSRMDIDKTTRTPASSSCPSWWMARGD